MELPSLTDPDGLFEYLIATILLLALFFTLYWAAIYLGYVETFL
jgi:hypothetical protein